MFRLILALLYTPAIWIFDLILHILSLWNGKIRLMIQGRKETISWLHSPKIIHSGQKVVWMHCSSLGEFEQGREILEGLRKNHPEMTLYLSFFSPSGYEIRKNWSIVNHVFYLPSDTLSHARLLIHRLQPDIFILVKYDFWWNLIRCLDKHQVPVILTAARFEKNKYYFKKPFLDFIKKWNYIFSIKKESVDVAQKYGVNNISVVGDPRIDRVLNIRKQMANLPERLTNVLKNKNNIIIYGSVWSEDVKIIRQVIQANPTCFHLIVPHDIEEAYVEKFTTMLPSTTAVFSKNQEVDNILIFDRIGYLSGLYAFASLVYIGGGFGKGIHNTLEPAVYGVPVLFGPKYHKFPEAIENLDNGNFFCIRHAKEMNEILKKQQDDPTFSDQIKKGLDDYFEEHKGASQKIIRYIETILLG